MLISDTKMTLSIHEPAMRKAWQVWAGWNWEDLLHFSVAYIYRAYTIGELPPQLLALLKKLDQELPEEQDQ